MERKVILAMVGGSLCIDPSDVDKVNLVDIKTKLREKYKADIPINIAPISTWMPSSGTEALMNEATKEMAERCLPNSPKLLYSPSSYNNRHARRAREARNRKR